MHLSESVGGQGFGLLELAIVLAEFGYGAVPGPFVPSAIASALISAHDPDAKLLNDLASGEVIAAYAIDSGLTATRHGDGLTIRGEVRAVCYPPADDAAPPPLLPPDPPLPPPLWAHVLTGTKSKDAITRTDDFFNMFGSPFRKQPAELQAVPKG